jgi:hypothetical protein
MDNGFYGEDGHLLSKVEIIIVYLSEDLVEPGSYIQGVTVPTHATKHHYHHAALLQLQVFIYKDEFF